MTKTYRLFFLLLSFIFLASSSCAISLPSDPIEQQWLQCLPSDRFNELNQLSLESLPGYHEQVVPYLQARGVEDNATIESLVRQDIFHITHALSVLFDQEQTFLLHNWLGEHSFLINGYNPQIDHVGRELLGPLSFYLPLLDALASKLELIHLRDLVFPSTQVVKALQEHDPSLLGVTIGRVYFQDLKNERRGCLELFQASPMDEKNPQFIEATLKRHALLIETKNSSMQTPIEHVSIELGSIKEVQQIHAHILELASKTLQPNQKEVSYNSGDGSTQTKVLLRDSTELPFNKIIEFVHYAPQ